MNKFKFNSTISVDPYLLPVYPDEVVKNEPMMFSANRRFAYENGGPITRDFISRFSDTIYRKNASEIIIDSRVHMSFKPGIFFAIPGYHLDDVPRTRKDGQPEHFKPAYEAQHAMMLINSHIAPTQFALGKGELDDVESGEKYYQKWHPQIVDRLNNAKMKKVNAPDRQIVFFDWQTWHQAVPTVKTGWRFFIRASWNTDRKPANEIRRQVQVYLPQPYEGW